ncbi:hypothetical protein HYV30_00370 [Candidatus Kaiserbacteria bacterium]|nr:hypothetical protein [Candidatus Kaiserbacteria bacterium]
MKNLRHHIEEVRSKPHHVRKQVTLAAAGAGTGLIALVWFAGSVATGSFAIEPSSFADAGKLPVIERGERGNEGIAGAAAALPSGDIPAHIEIVDAASSTVRTPSAGPTTIPF